MKKTLEPQAPVYLNSSKGLPGVSNAIERFSHLKEEILSAAGDGAMVQSYYTKDSATEKSEYPAFRHIRVGLVEVPGWDSWYSNNRLNLDPSSLRYDEKDTVCQALDKCLQNPDRTPTLFYQNDVDGSVRPVLSGLGVTLRRASSSAATLGSAILKASMLPGIASSALTTSNIMQPGLANRIADGLKPVQKLYTPSWIDPKGFTNSVDFEGTVTNGPVGDDFLNSVGNVNAGIVANRMKSPPLPSQSENFSAVWNGRTERKALSFMEATSSQATSLDINLLNALRESAELPGTIITLLKLYSYYLKPSRLIGRPGRLVKGLADQYLNYQFGIKPTLGDIKTVFKVLDDISVGKTHIPVSSKLWLSGYRSAVPYDNETPLNPAVAYDLEYPTQNDYAHSSQWVDWQFVRDKSETPQISSQVAFIPREICRVKAYVPVKSFNKYLLSRNSVAGLQSGNAVLDSAAQRVGLTATTDELLYVLADMLWEAIPFSFVVDYFLGISDILQTVHSNKDQTLLDLGEYSLYRFSGLEVLQAFHSAVKTDDSFKTIQGSPMFSSILARIGVRDFTRWHGFRRYDPALTLDSPSSQAWVNMAALASKFIR